MTTSKTPSEQWIEAVIWYKSASSDEIKAVFNEPWSQTSASDWVRIAVAALDQAGLLVATTLNQGEANSVDTRRLLTSIETGAPMTPAPMSIGGKVAEALKLSRFIHRGEIERMERRIQAELRWVKSEVEDLESRCSESSARSLGSKGADIAASIAAIQVHRDAIQGLDRIAAAAGIEPDVAKTTTG